jgi:hypothetical protein
VETDVSGDFPWQGSFQNELEYHVVHSRWHELIYHCHPDLRFGYRHAQKASEHWQAAMRIVDEKINTRPDHA